MKKLHFLLLALFAAIVMVGCETPGIDQPQPEPFPTPDPAEVPLISTYPAFITEETTEDITIILNTKGTAANNFTGELYAHTGVLTSASKDNGDWKHVLSSWGQNIPECKLENKGNNIWYYTIKGGVRAWYKVKENETVTHLAFVFRSSDNKIEVKDNGADIFIELAEEGLAVKFLSPKHGAKYQVGDEIVVQTQQQAAASVKLYQNGEEVLEYHLWTPKWTEMLQNSKFSAEAWPIGFELLNNCGGAERRGYIGVQDHGDDVWYRNIRIKVME